MAKKKELPLIAICGRPNVGKSTLFNRITGKARAIVHDEEGITRDRTYGVGDWEGHRFRIVDTGGIIENPVDPVSKQMQDQVRAALSEARVIIFVVDGQADITRTDEEVKEALFRYGKPVVLAANKLDNDKLAQNRFDFYSLGMGEPFAISSGHGTGVSDLMDAVVKHLPDPATLPEEEEDTGPRPFRIAVVGKPNVGKSSFINAVMNEPRAIVDDVPGTTRDSIDIDFTWQDKQYVLIDTAGMRKKAGIKKFVEHFSVSRSLRAINRADVCLVMVDAQAGLSEQDKRIIGYCREQGTAMLLVWTKWDLIEEKAERFKALRDNIALKMPQIAHVPFVTISNVTRLRIFDVFKHVETVAEQVEKRVPTAALNKFVEDIRARHAPPTQKGKQAKIRYATQTGIKPTTFVLFVNQKSLFHFSYMRYIENRLRDEYGFQGVPIHIELREGKPRE